MFSSNVSVSHFRLHEAGAWFTIQPVGGQCVVNAQSDRKWTGSSPETSPFWTGPIRTKSVTPYLRLLDLYLLGYRGQKCRLHALTIQHRKIFPPPAQCHYLRAAADNLRCTSPTQWCQLQLLLRCRRRHAQQSSSRSAAVLSHCPGVNSLPPQSTPHPTLPVDGRPLFSQRADCDQTPSPASRRSFVVLLLYTGRP